MIDLSGEQMAEYWRRSHDTVDGLWFMKVEERYGFDTALDIDDEVWKVLPKIKARMLKTMGSLQDGMGGLFESVTTKLSLEGFTFEAEWTDHGSAFQVVLAECPWHHTMIRAGREHLSGRVGTLICNTEYSVWAAEFGSNIAFHLSDQICEGRRTCVLEFTSAPDTTPSSQP
jgi:hypothetical protein